MFSLNNLFDTHDNIDVLQKHTKPIRKEVILFRKIKTELFKKKDIGLKCKIINIISTFIKTKKCTEKEKTRISRIMERIENHHEDSINIPCLKMLFTNKPNMNEKCELFSGVGTIYYYETVV